MKWQILGLAGMMALGASQADAQVTPLRRMDCGTNGAAFPLCGANRTVGNDSVGTRWTRAYIASENAVEIYIVPGSTGEGYYGWDFSGLPAPASGATRVVRFRIKPISPIQWTNWGVKFFILGDASGTDENRVIGTMEMYQGQPALNVDKNIDGTRAWSFLPADQWSSIQVIIAPSGSGYNFRYYLNGALVSTSVNFNIDPRGWQEIGFGLYGQFANGSGNIRYRFKDAEIDDAYDPNYHTGTSPGGPPTPPTAPAAPSNVRIVS